MIDTGGVRAWRFVKRNPDCIEAQGKAPAVAPEEPAPFPSPSSRERALPAS